MDNKSCNNGYKGDCCCNCKNQLELACHPSNHKIGKGSILDNIGYICLGLNKEDPTYQKAVFMDNKHGMCELYSKK